MTRGTPLYSTGKKYEYNPYKSSQLGMYGEIEKQMKKRPKSAQKEMPMRQRTLKTFECYKAPAGPDIPIKNTGPDYPAKEYRNKGDAYRYRDPDRLLKSYKEKPAVEPARNYKDPLINNKQSDYKLKERNNLGMRDFHCGYVDDTIMFKVTEPRYRNVLVHKTPEEKPMAAVKPKSPAEEKKKSHVTPVPVPIALPPPKKKFADSSTQHDTPRNKTSHTQTQPLSMKAFGTQYEPTKSKHINIQTDTPQPVVPVAAAGAVMAHPPKKPTVSKSVQASDPQKTLKGTGTQYSGPSTKQATIQTSPVIFATQTSQRIPSPEPVRVVQTETVQQYARSPSPQAVPRTETPPRQTITPPYQSSEWSPTPVVPVVVPVRRDTPPRRVYTPPRAVTPPRQNTPTRVNTPPRTETPPHIETPRWESPQYRLTPEPHERAISPPRTYAPVIVPVQTHKRQSPIPVATTTATPEQVQARAAPVQTPTSELVTPVSPEVTPPRRVYSPHPVYSPERASPMYPQPAHTQTPPLIQQPYFNPGRTESTQPRQQFPVNTYSFPTNSSRWKLPPEVNACIEAYDNVHTDLGSSGNTLPSVRRTMRYT